MKIYSALYHCFHPLDAFFPTAKCVTVDHPHDLDGPGILIVHGGADISPSLYKRGVSYFTGATEKPSERDLQEWALMEEAKKQGIPIFGICRGAQMLCAFNGGFLIQDVTGHEGSPHDVETDNGVPIVVNSYHHQMQYPFNIPHKLLAYSKGISRHYLDVNKTIKLDVEPEAVFYPETNSIGVQWHPEWLKETHISNLWLKDKVHEYWKNV